MENNYANIQKKWTRRDFIKITAGMGGVLLGGGLIRTLFAPHLTLVHDSRLLMGTIVNLTVMAESEAQGQAAINATYAAMTQLIQLFDYRRSDTELSQLNQTGSLANPSPELVNLMRNAIWHSELSDGAFDVTVLPVLEAYQANHQPTDQERQLVDYRKIHIQEDKIQFMQPGMAVTLDAIAKGRIVDGGVSQLKKIGYDNILVEAGGDLLASGKHPDGEPWKIGVINPRAVTEKKWLATFSVQDQAVATSGDYQNAFTSDYTRNHIIDPHTGQSPSELASVTTIASTVMEADAFSTTLMVLGVEKGLRLVEQLPGIEAFLVTKELKTYRSSGFPSFQNS